jgi:hypothetical protein
MGTSESTAGPPDPAPAAEQANATEAAAIEASAVLGPGHAEPSAGGDAVSAIDADAVAAMQGFGSSLGPSADLPGDLGLSGDHDLLAALHGLDGVGNIDHALDQLTSSADLFDLPALDFGDGGPHSGGSES